MEIYKIQIYRDGDQWCVLYGDNIVEGICVFGDTIQKALSEFDKAFDEAVINKTITDDLFNGIKQPYDSHSDL